MGYISAERCGWIGRMVAEGREIKAIFQEATRFGALIRLSLDGRLPELPPARDIPNQPADWWPDYIPPDD